MSGLKCVSIFLIAFGIIRDQLLKKLTIGVGIFSSMFAVSYKIPSGKRKFGMPVTIP
jgi:hypothetical protein